MVLDCFSRGIKNNKKTSLLDLCARATEFEGGMSVFELEKHFGRKFEGDRLLNMSLSNEVVNYPPPPTPNKKNQAASST